MARRELSFGRRLQDLREAAGLTQADLARKAKVSRPALSKFEQGEREPSWEIVCQLAAALDVSVAAFQNQATAGAGEVSKRLWQAARAYARAYDQVERQSRTTSGESVQLFAKFQEAQVELNLAALDSFAGKAAGSR
jgi:transcriptional regulator with XRE-family HTH domain